MTDDPDLAESEAQAIDSGKQKFELTEFEWILKRGPQDEAERKRSYYIQHPEFQTMGEFAKYLQNTEPWPDHTPRSLAEMRFAASLVPCPHCGSTLPTSLDLQGGGNSWVLYGPCSSCGKARSMKFVTRGDPLGRKHDRLELGGAEPSRIITPEQLITELERLLPATHAEPATLDVASWLEATALSDRAVTVARELVKFPAYVRYRCERDRLDARADRFAADAPRIWMLRQHRLSLGEEIRGLFNQVTKARVPTLADVQTYLERRPSVVQVGGGSVLAELDADSAVAKIRAYDEHGAMIVVLHPRSGTRSEIKDAVWPTGAPPVFEHHRLGMVVAYDGDNAKLVTLTFGRATPTGPTADAPAAHAPVPETDAALRARVSAVLCEKCGTRLGQPDVFRSGIRAVLSVRCSQCSTARSCTLPIAPGVPPPARRTIKAETVVRALIEPPSPPLTVGALLDALEIELDTSTIAASTKGSIVIPRRFKDWQFTQRSDGAGVATNRRTLRIGERVRRRCPRRDGSRVRVTRKR